MKRILSDILSLFLAAVLLVSGCVSAFAEEGDYIGNMQVINCNEWVSLRKQPRASSPRLVKVSLGSIVSNCRYESDEWVYCEFDGYSGYIMAQYLESSDGALTFNAMMVTTTPEGAPFYAAVDSTEPLDYIPANTIVRDCVIMDNGRVYVEWGCRSGYINLMHAEAYSEMLHFPRQITLRVDPFGGEDEDGPAPALQIADSSIFPIMEYEEHTYFEYADYMAADDPELPKVTFVLYTDTTINHVHLFSVSMSAWDEEHGEDVYEATLEEIQYQMDSDHPMHVGAVIWGDSPNLAVGYEDAEGVYHFAFIEISGEDGSLYLREF